MTEQSKSGQPLLDPRELDRIHEQFERQRPQLSSFLQADYKRERNQDLVAVLTWPVGSVSAIVVSKTSTTIWLRTVGLIDAPARMNLCPGLDGAPYSQLVVNSHFRFSDGVLLELKVS